MTKYITYRFNYMKIRFEPISTMNGFWYFILGWYCRWQYRRRGITARTVCEGKVVYDTFLEFEGINPIKRRYAMAFRKFMVRYFIGLAGFNYRWRGKQRRLTWIKGAPIFLSLFVITGIIAICIKPVWIHFAAAAVTLAFVSIFGFWYPIKYPLTAAEANEFEKPMKED